MIRRLDQERLLQDVSRWREYNAFSSRILPSLSTCSQPWLCVGRFLTGVTQGTSSLSNRLESGQTRGNMVHRLSTFPSGPDDSWWARHITLDSLTEGRCWRGLIHVGAFLAVCTPMGYPPESPSAGQETESFRRGDSRWMGKASTNTTARDESEDKLHVPAHNMERAVVVSCDWRVFPGWERAEFSL
ncbi:hypothetical protein BO99DRAFT_232801 [Aspergillus violaceofuscus CBS 115571]|uniref:Uncharacterized protein n=1 Tax=Aspergillus violaceofuscus (strain CBS 115571) TaxID=1450538 RepID=A0A2V5H5L7_ASPV1|nr:hypothetical protein BO99DRAFT_232801 [Aspergillus violaceofuscus CBS 115571]